MGLFDLIASVIQIFTDLIPRLSTRPKVNEYQVVDHCIFGVFISRRSWLYIPLLDHVEYYPRVDVPVDSDIQTLLTSDGHTITVNAAFTFRITDPLLVRDKWGEDYYGANVAMVVRGAIEETYSRNTWDEVLEMSHESIIHPIRKELELCGVELTYFCMEDRSNTRSIRHYGVNIANVNH